jgi:mRNA interferase RelE/StbE
MYQLEYTKDALKALQRIPTDQSKLITKKLKHLAEDPQRPNNNVKALKGRPGYRLRVGDWRVIYKLEHNRLIIFVLEIGPRGTVYE